MKRGSRQHAGYGFDRDKRTRRGVRRPIGRVKHGRGGVAIEKPGCVWQGVRQLRCDGIGCGRVAGTSCTGKKMLESLGGFIKKGELYKDEVGAKINLREGGFWAVEYVRNIII